jgi:hypothetical protein
MATVEGSMLIETQGKKIRPILGIHGDLYTCTLPIKQWSILS